MKKKGFTLIELLAVIIILALILIIAIPRIMDAVREARIKSFENDVLAIYKTMEKAVHEFELNVPEGREADYEQYFSSENIYPGDFNFDLDSHTGKFTIETGYDCPTEFWSSSKEHCQYYYDPTIGVESLLIVADIPKGIQPYYSNNDDKYIFNTGFPAWNTHRICQALYAPTWKKIDVVDFTDGSGYHFSVDEEATGFVFLNCYDVSE